MKVTVAGEEKVTAAAKGRDAAIDETLEFILGRKEINAREEPTIDIEVWDYRLINHFKVNNPALHGLCPARPALVCRTYVRCAVKMYIVQHSCTFVCSTGYIAVRQCIHTVVTCSLKESDCCCGAQYAAYVIYLQSDANEHVQAVPSDGLQMWTALSGAVLLLLWYYQYIQLIAGQVPAGCWLGPSEF